MTATDERGPAGSDHAPVPAVGHPRPQLRREGWISLDGPWDFALDPKAEWEEPTEVKFDATIAVPFAPETPASGVDHPDFLAACWYRRSVEVDPPEPGERLVLHFGAVDYAATVWLDGQLAVRHEGGYSPFAVDVTRALAAPGPHEIVVRAEDDPLDLAKPRGKQDWEREPHSIWYTRTTGIWQTVWLERLPRVAVTGLQWEGDLERYEVGVEVRLGGAVDEPGLRLRVVLEGAGRQLVDDLVGVNGKRLERAFRLDGTGLDTLRDALTWSPAHPALVDATLELIDAEGTVVDRVYSYAAMRTVGVRAGRFLLNGKPFPLRFVLDQGYWLDTGLTPPGDDALRRDVELVKAMGFNGVRKHQKIEDPRYLYWADRLGLLVWAEMPPCYRFDNEAVRRLTREWAEAIERDRSHPCIVAWVPFNESTGLLNLPTRAEQRHYMEGVSLLTKALDPTRPVVTNDGWENLAGDVVGVHDYDQDPERLRRRYEPERLAHVLATFGNHGRLQALDDPARLAGELTGVGPRPLVLTEFGGIGWAEDHPTAAVTAPTATAAPADTATAPVEPTGEPAPGGEVPLDRLTQPAAWGYSAVHGPEELARRYAALLDAVHSMEALAGFCYTQFADTYQEVNGLVRADRTPKFPIEEIRRATVGPSGVWPALG